MKLWIRCGAVAAAACFAGSLAGCATVDPKRVTRADMQRRLADMKLSKGQYEVAIREYWRSLELYPDDAETYFGLAEAYRRKGLYGDAEAQLRKALRLDPSHHEARLNLGAVLLQQERWAESIAVNQVLVDDPMFIRPSRALVNIGWGHYQLGDLSSAKAAFVEALSGAGTNLQAHLNLGIVLYDQGDVVEAIRHFQAAVDLSEARPVGSAKGVEAEARFRMAKAHVKLGQLDRAIENLRDAAKRGGGEWGRRSKEYLQVLE